MAAKRNRGTRRPSKKLDYKKAGTFPITKVVGKCAFRVQLPEGVKNILYSHATLRTISG